MYSERVFRLLTPNGRSRLATDARDILSLICRLCIFVVRSVCFKLMQRDTRLASKVKPTGGWTFAVDFDFAFSRRAYHERS